MNHPKILRQTAEILDEYGSATEDMNIIAGCSREQLEGALRSSQVDFDSPITGEIPAVWTCEFRRTTMNISFGQTRAVFTLENGTLADFHNVCSQIATTLTNGDNVKTGLGRCLPTGMNAQDLNLLIQSLPETSDDSTPAKLEALETLAKYSYVKAHQRGLRFGDIIDVHIKLLRHQTMAHCAAAILANICSGIDPDTFNTIDTVAENGQLGGMVPALLKLLETPGGYMDREKQRESLRALANITVAFPSNPSVVTFCNDMPKLRQISDTVGNDPQLQVQFDRLIVASEFVNNR